MSPLSLCQELQLLGTPRMIAAICELEQRLSLLETNLASQQYGLEIVSPTEPANRDRSVIAVALAADGDLHG